MSSGDLQVGLIFLGLLRSNQSLCGSQLGSEQSTAWPGWLGASAAGTAGNLLQGAPREREDRQERWALLREHWGHLSKGWAKLLAACNEMELPARAAVSGPDSPAGSIDQAVPLWPGTARSQPGGQQGGLLTSASALKARRVPLSEAS